MTFTPAIVITASPVAPGVPSARAFFDLCKLKTETIELAGMAKGRHAADPGKRLSLQPSPARLENNAPL